MPACIDRTLQRKSKKSLTLGNMRDSFEAFRQFSKAVAPAPQSFYQKFCALFSTESRYDEADELLRACDDYASESEDSSVAAVALLVACGNMSLRLHKQEHYLTPFRVTVEDVLEQYLKIDISYVEQAFVVGFGDGIRAASGRRCEELIGLIRQHDPLFQRAAVELKVIV